MSTSNDWTKDRQAAHLAAFQEVRRLTQWELAENLSALADECADRAGDVANHDDAFPDLMQEALCRFAAELLKKHL